MSGSGRTSDTYVVSYSNVTVPDLQDATVIGFGNGIALGANDTLDIQHGDGDSVTGSLGGAITVETSNNFTIDDPGVSIAWDTPSTTMTVLDGADVTLVEPTGTPTINIGGSTTAENSVTGTSAVTVNVTEGVYALIDDPNAVLKAQSGGTSYTLTGLPAASEYVYYGNSNNASGVVNNIEAFSGAPSNTTYLASLTEFTDGSSAVGMPEPGDYGIYHGVFYYSGSYGQGVNDETVYDAYNGTSLISIDKIFSPANSSSTIENGVAYYSAPDLGGYITSGTFNYTDGSSSLVQQGNGAYGCYQTVTFYTGQNQTGPAFATSYNFVNGHSQTDTVGNGGYGIYQVLLRTEGLNGHGVIDELVFDVVNGTSQVITPAAGDASETITFMSGLDGTGNELSSMTVGPGTALARFEAFTGRTLTDPVYASATASVALADFKAGVTHLAAPVVAAGHPVMSAAMATAHLTGSAPLPAVRLHS